MFDNQLRPIYQGRVLVNKTAMQDPAVKAALEAMSKRNFEPQEITATECGIYRTDINVTIYFYSHTNPY